MLTLEARVAALEDRQAVHALLANYNRGIDEKDEELFRSIWNDDARWDIGEPFGAHEGHAQIVDIVRVIWQALPETHHFTTNEVIDVAGDTATAVCDAHCTATDAKGRAMLVAASYRDRARRIDGTWKLTERNVQIHYLTPVTEPWSDDPASRINI